MCSLFIGHSGHTRQSSVSADGKLAYAGAIDSKPTPKAADIAKATPYLANAVDAVLAGKTPEPAETKPYGCGVKL